MKTLIRIMDIDSTEAAAQKMLGLGAHKAGIDIMKEKAVFKTVLLKNVSSPAANIIKQEILSLGGEAANAHGVINCSVERSDMMVFATLKQLGKLAKKLKQHPFGLKGIADNLQLSIYNYQLFPPPLSIRNKIFCFGEKTFIMGILNITPDSFSDGGKFNNVAAAVEQALRMIKDGADIIDIGGESTRPGADTVGADEEIKRVVPVIEQIREKSATVISIDTRKAAVATAALDAGADMVNDVSALRFDKDMAGLIAERKVPVCLMHSQGTPKTMQENPSYSDIISELLESLKDSIEIATNAGILCEKIIVDPGIGFGKKVQDNLDILAGLKELKVLGRPILIGTSRKSFIGNVLDKKVDKRLPGTAGSVAVAITHGADIIRVHDTAEMADVALICDAILRRKGYGKEKN